MSEGRNIITPEELAKIRNPAAAGILVLCQDTNEYLLAKRNPKASFYGGVWSVPSGEANVNQMESMENCARREFLEETQFQIPPDQPIRLIDRYYVDERMYFLFLYKVKKKFFIQLDNEHTEAGWFTKETLPEPISAQILDAISRL